ncbi:MAG TPA: hypothetical protein VIL20_28040, partial [Sandaracinaceae bacterium]
MAPYELARRTGPAGLALLLAGCVALTDFDRRGKSDAGQSDAGAPEPDAHLRDAHVPDDSGTDAGPNLCEGVVCHESACSTATCDPATGACITRNEGGACDDESICSWNDECGNGECAGIVTDCDPGTLTFAAAGGTPSTGGPASSRANARDVHCPDGEVIIGARLGAVPASATAYAHQISQLEFTCGRVEAVETGVGWVLQITPSSVLPRRGKYGRASTGPEQSIQCPPGQVVTGHEIGQTGPNHVAELTLRCAPLALHTDARQGFSVVVGDTNPADRAGAPAEVITTRTGAVDCPAGSVARGVRIYADEVVDVLGLRCGVPTPHPITTAPLQGTSDGALHQDDCPPSYLPVGLVFYPTGDAEDQHLGHLQVLCGRMLVNDDFTYATRGLLRVPETGGRGNDPRYESGSPLQVECEPGEIMVGVEAVAGPDGRPEDLAIQCAPLILSGDPEVGLNIERGTVRTTELFGTGRGVEPLSPATCPEGMAASGLYTRAGGFVEALALRCVTPVFRPLVEMSLPPVADTYVCASLTENQGASEELRVRSSSRGYDCRTLLRFETSALPDEAVVQFVALRATAWGGYAWG